MAREHVGAVAEGLVDRGEAVQLGQRDRLGHLRAHPGSTGGGGLAQPLRRARPDGQDASSAALLN